MYEKYRQLLRQNPLLANAANLMLSAGVTAAFGFVFWIVVAHGFHSETVGLATTLLSVSGLISLLGLAGFDTVFVRFLSRSKQRNEQINGGLIVSGLATALIASLFCLLIPVVSPKLAFVNHNAWYIVGFIVFTVFATWNTLTNAVLVAYRRTSFVVVINIIFSAVKMILPFTIHTGGPMMIFAFAGLAQIINVALSVAALMKYFDYKPTLKLRLDVLKKLRKYGLSVYIAHLLNLLPDSLLPIIIINRLGATAAAYFFIAFTIANLLYTVSFATTQALLAEVSHDEEHAWEHIRKGIRVVALILIPASLLLILVCPFVLTLFGHGYQHGATGLLRILSLSSLAVALYSIMGTVFKLDHNLRAITITNAVNAVSIIGLSILLVGRFGINGVGWAWLIGNIISVVVGAFMSLSWLKAQRLAATVA